MSNRLLTVGPEENAFNTRLTKWINDIPNAVGHKTAGSSFTRAFPDIIGGFEGAPFYLEQKHAQMRENLRDDTIIIGTGCSNPKKRWSDFQKLWLRKMDEVLHEKILGGIVGIKGYGDSAHPDLFLGVNQDFVENGFLTTRDVRDIWNGRPGVQFLEVRWPYEYINAGIEATPDCLSSLLREMRTVDTAWQS